MVDRLALLLQCHRGSQLFRSPWKPGPSRHVLTDAPARAPPGVFVTSPSQTSYSYKTLTEFRTDEYIQQNFQTGIQWRSVLFFLLLVTTNTSHSCFKSSSFFLRPKLPLYCFILNLVIVCPPFASSEYCCCRTLSSAFWGTRRLLI